MCILFIIIIAVILAIILFVASFGFEVSEFDMLPPELKEKARPYKHSFDITFEPPIKAECGGKEILIREICYCAGNCVDAALFGWDIGGKYYFYTAEPICDIEHQEIHELRIQNRLWKCFISDNNTIVEY